MIGDRGGRLVLIVMTDGDVVEELGGVISPYLVRTKRGKTQSRVDICCVG